MICGVLSASRWEHLRRIAAEQVECLLLSGCRGRDQLEVIGAADGAVVESAGGETGEQSVVYEFSFFAALDQRRSAAVRGATEPLEPLIEGGTGLLPCFFIQFLANAVNGNCSAYFSSNRSPISPSTPQQTSLGACS